MTIDAEAFLNQTIFGIDTSAMLHDVLDFLNFSELNIVEQRERELIRVGLDCDEAEIEDEYLAGLYRLNMVDSVKFRFDVLLAQRVRYAALTSTITTIEWVLTALARRLKQHLAKRPKGVSEVAHLLRELGVQAGIATPQADMLSWLVQVRNCVVHAAGLLDSYDYEDELRASLQNASGTTVSNINFLGDAIEIENGYLQTVLKDALLWLPQLERSLHDARAFMPPAPSHRQAGR